MTGLDKRMHVSGTWCWKAVPPHKGTTCTRRHRVSHRPWLCPRAEGFAFWNGRPLRNYGTADSHHWEVMTKSTRRIRPSWKSGQSDCTSQLVQAWGILQWSFPTRQVNHDGPQGSLTPLETPPAGPWSGSTMQTGSRQYGWTCRSSCRAGRLPRRAARCMGVVPPSCATGMLASSGLIGQTGGHHECARARVCARVCCLFVCLCGCGCACMQARGQACVWAG